MTIILRVLEGPVNFKRTNEQSEHLKLREQRLKLIVDNATPIYHYEIFRKKDNSRQIHSLYSDGTLFVHNINTGLIITIMLLKRSELAKYLSFTGEDFSGYPTAHKCAKLHERISKEETEENLDYFRNRKVNILKGSLIGR